MAVRRRGSAGADRSSTGTGPRRGLALLSSLLCLLLPRPARAVLPTASIDVYFGTTNHPLSTFHVSQASFGGQVAEYSERYQIHGYKIEAPPDDDALLCNEEGGTADYTSSEQANAGATVMLVPRGKCSFERKALSAQRLGASAVIIYGTLSSRYSLNFTNTTLESNDANTRTDYALGDVIWPEERVDYDCDRGEARLPKSVVDELGLPNTLRHSTENEKMLSGYIGGDNLCARYDSTKGDKGGYTKASGGGGKSFADTCESNRCLVTGRKGDADRSGDATYQACCAWDMHVWLFGDYTMHHQSSPTADAGSVQADSGETTTEGTAADREAAAAAAPALEEVTIPAVYITMSQFDDLKASANGNLNEIHVTLYERYQPRYNWSAPVIWSMGVFVAWLAARSSSGDIRRASGAVLAHRRSSGGGGGDGEGHEGGSEETGKLLSGADGGGGTTRMRSHVSAGGGGAGGQHEQRSVVHAADASASDDAAAAAAVRAFAVERANSNTSDEESVELSAAHSVAFILQASMSLCVLFFFKIYSFVKVLYGFGCSGAFATVIVQPALTALCLRANWDGPLRATLKVPVLGLASAVDVASTLVSYGVGGIWLWVAFTVPHPSELPIYWIVQDVFGLCMCVLFLEAIKLNSIKVGAKLLVAAFFFDIFFVFVTPLLTPQGDSIMVTVATSGGPPKADPSWCEKYPFDDDCKGGDPLPMLLAFPHLNNYQGGCAMLGLGDIVLPGLLLSFASRYDESKRLMGLISGGSDKVASNCSSGKVNYFGPVMVGYAAGLFMANSAAYIMQMGQPALLYLVPSCLGTMVYLGYRAGELHDLWEGPRVVRAVEKMMCDGKELDGAADIDAGDRQADGSEMKEMEMT